MNGPYSAYVIGDYTGITPPYWTISGIGTKPNVQKRNHGGEPFSYSSPASSKRDFSFLPLIVTRGR